MTDVPTATIGLGPLRPAPAGLPDPAIAPPTIAEAGDPFSDACGSSTCWPGSSVARPVRLADVVDRLNATYLDWLFSVPVVADVALQLQANWMADYRNSSGIVVDDGPLGPTIAIEDSSRVDPWIVRQALRESAVVYRAAGRVQPPRPTDVGRLNPGAANPVQDSQRPITSHSGRTIDMSHHEYANENALVDSDWALAHLTDPNVRFVEVDVDTTAYEQSHLPGAVGWNWTSQLSDGIRRDIAGREDFSALLSAVGDRPGHDDRAVRRQQQLVRGVGLLAAQAVRPRRRPDPQRRAQVLAGQRPRARRSTSRRTRRPATSCPSPTSACGPSATTSCRASAIPGSRSSTSARRPSTTARSSRPRA